MTKPKKIKVGNLDKYEREILESYERGEWTPVENMKAEIKRLATYAKESMRKRKSERINIRLPKPDLDDIKMIALKEGLPYQTLIASVLHKYAEEKIKTS